MSEQMSFEQAVKRLEEITGKLEAGQVPLSESLKLFEEGVGLVRFCTGELDKAEAQIKILTRNQQGEVVEADFVPTEG
ncbi:MAG: exodeoxyribonuclease VII small subunit [Clostridia bacterium]|nr:exodeoxyribonuclease VII small subunit [Clostridia bacterium]